MLFFEYFKAKLNERIQIVLKNEMKVSGILTNIDPFLNMRIEDAIFEDLHPGLRNMTVCSIRGSSVKLVSLKADSKLEDRVSDATRIKYCLEIKE